MAHRGLGTASCGPDTLPAYLVGPGTYRWSWTGAGRMTIEWRPDDRQFHLHNGRVSMILRVYEDGSWAAFISVRRSRRAGHTATSAGPVRGFGNRVGDPVPFVYPTAGTGDFRVPALVASGIDGSGTAVLRVRGPRDRAREAIDRPIAVDLCRIR